MDFVVDINKWKHSDDEHHSSNLAFLCSTDEIPSSGLRNEEGCSESSRSTSIDQSDPSSNTRKSSYLAREDETIVQMLLLLNMPYDKNCSSKRNERRFVDSAVATEHSDVVDIQEAASRKSNKCKVARPLLYRKFHRAESARKEIRFPNACGNHKRKHQSE